MDKINDPYKNHSTKVTILTTPIGEGAKYTRQNSLFIQEEISKAKVPPLFEREQNI